MFVMPYLVEQRPISHTSLLIVLNGVDYLAEVTDLLIIQDYLEYFLKMFQMLP